MLSVVRITASRDGWDVAVIVATLFTGMAAAAGLIALIPIVRQLRRRPELSLSWWFEGQLWDESSVVEMEPGTIIHAGVGATNIGDAGGETSLYNVIFTNRFRLTSDPWVKDGKPSGNTITGPCTYLAEERRFHIGLTWQINFMIMEPAQELNDDTPGDFPLVFELSDERFNARGRRIRVASSIFRRKTSLLGAPWLRISATPGVTCGIGTRTAQRTVRRVAAGPNDRRPEARLVNIDASMRSSFSTGYASGEITARP
jgi:hypothetical protein